MAADKRTIKRTIHYYELIFEFHPEFVAKDGDKFRELFHLIYKLAKAKESSRYQYFGEKAIFIQDVKIDPQDKLVTGKLRCVRKDVLPEIMNTITDEAHGIEAKDEEGLVETTHFIIDFSKRAKKLAIEHNQFGAKISHFAAYIQEIGFNKNATKRVDYVPIVKDELSKIRNRINRCSEFHVKVHKDNIDKIQTIDKGLFSALNTSIEQFKSEYATLKLKFNYKQRAATSEINNSIFNIIGSLIKNKSNTEYFNVLSIKAEDSDKNDRLENFDLLVDKIRSEVWVEKKQRYRTVESLDIFEKMKSELIKKKV